MPPPLGKAIGLARIKAILQRPRDNFCAGLICKNAQLDLTPPTVLPIVCAQAFKHAAMNDGKRDYYTVTDDSVAEAYKVSAKPAVVFFRQGFDVPRVRRAISQCYRLAYIEFCA